MTKRDLVLAREINDLLAKPTLTLEEVEHIYESYDPAFDSGVTDKAAFFTPLDLAMDTALFSYRHGNLVDCCSGIGALTYSLLTRNYYEESITSITLLEFNPHFLGMSKKLLSPLSAHTYSRKPIELCFSGGSVWDQTLWEAVMRDRGGKKFDAMVSNPPYSTAGPQEKEEARWMNYAGERELMAIELCHRYAEQGTFVLPRCSVEFTYSGRPYYERVPSNKVARLRKANPGMDLFMECNGIDGSIYREQWKNTKISVEVADVTFNGGL